MTFDKTEKALKSIAAEFTVTKTKNDNYQAIAPNGEVLATGRNESSVRAMAESEYARRRRGSESLNRIVRLGSTTRDIVL